MLKYARIMHIHGFDISRALSHARVLPVIHHGLYVMHEGLPVMHEGLSVMYHDCNHDSGVLP